MKFELVQVPPPKQAPLDERADMLGLVRGLVAEPRYRQSRCCNCRQMQPKGSWLVWVPDGVIMGDPSWSVEEACREGAFNGQRSGWCLPCASRLGKDRSTADAIPDDIYRMSVFAIATSVAALVAVFAFVH